MRATYFQRSISIICAALVCVLLFVALPYIADADIQTITVEVNKPGAAVNPAMFGIFFEDINFAADGGIYAEMVKNRSFEFPDPLMGWKQIERDVQSSPEVLEREAIQAGNRHYLRVASNTGMTNEGFRGMGVQNSLRLQLNDISSVAVTPHGGGPSCRGALQVARSTPVWAAVTRPRRCGRWAYPTTTSPTFPPAAGHRWNTLRARPSRAWKC